MYGLVNKGIQDLVCSRFSEAVWTRIKERAGVDIDAFISMDAYPDELTYSLVEAASAELGLPADTVLRSFGEHWVLYTAREGYGELLRMGGTSVRDFLLNLQNLHTHLALTFPHLKPPSFWCSDVSESELCLHYESDRQGLAPMVIGLLDGLGRMYDTKMTVLHTRNRAEGAEHDEFLVRFA